MENPNNFLMGGGVKSARFFGAGASVSGTIVRDPEVRQQTNYTTKEPKFFKNGDPMMQLVVQVQTDQRDEQDAADKGIRAFYIKGKQLTAVVREAVKAVGAPGLEVGGQLTLTWVSGGPRYQGDTSWQIENPKVYAARYVRPVSQDAANFLEGGQGQPETAASTAAGQPPEGVDPAVWAQMGADQRATVLAAVQGAR